MKSSPALMSPEIIKNQIPKLENPTLIICGPTATGKTAFAVQIARQFNGELISADSRQVYTGLDIITGKDHGDFPVHLIDVVEPDQAFSVSRWHDLAVKAITDIRARGKLPVVVGGTGLYFKSLLSPLSDISVPPNPQLRSALSGLTSIELFNKLKKDYPFVADSLNTSDSRNPRRLIRKYEIAKYKYNNFDIPLPGSRGVGAPATEGFKNGVDFLLIGLKTNITELDKRINQRVADRLKLGAASEAKVVLARYPHNLPALSACGYLSFLTVDPVSSWQAAEHHYARRQLTWFKKQPGIQWYDVSTPAWQAEAYKSISEWYNKDSHE